MIDKPVDGRPSPLRTAWRGLAAHLTLLEPLDFHDDEWSLLERMHERFDDRDVHVRLPLALARFRDEAKRAIHAQARAFDELRTDYVDEAWLRDKFGADGAGQPADPMAAWARRYNDEVDAMMRVLVPQAVYRKGHYAYGRFTEPMPHGLHTDHSAEDAAAGGEPICIARIATLGTHYLAGDARTLDAATQSRLLSLRHWIAVPEGEPEDILDTLLADGTLRTIPLDHVVLMVAGNSSATAQATQHIAARPPPGGVHSAFFQRQYRLA